MLLSEYLYLSKNSQKKCCLFVFINNLEIKKLITNQKKSFQKYFETIFYFLQNQAQCFF